MDYNYRHWRVDGPNWITRVWIIGKALSLSVKKEMKPEIFMNDFKRTIWTDAHYSVIGRALTFATRFESLCKTLNVLVGIKRNETILESKEEVTKFVNKLYSLPLVQHISLIAKDENELRNILNKGRRARNEIVHEITVGLDRCIDSLPEEYINDLMKRLRKLINDLAEADRAVCFIISILTNELLPHTEFLKEYPYLIEQWVMKIKLPSNHESDGIETSYLIKDN